MLFRRVLHCCPMTFLVVLCNTNMSYDSVAADVVQMTSKLLGNPGWRNFDPLVIKYGGKWCTVESMLGPVGSSDTVVTVDNVDSKIQQAHQFLSCQYDVVFMTYNAYLGDLADRCGAIEGSPPDRRYCLDTFWQVFDPKMLVSRMEGALSFLNSISTKISLKTDVFDILKQFERAYQPDEVMRYDFEMLSKTNRTLSRLHESALVYFENNCGPKTYLTGKKIGNPAYSWVWAKNTRTVLKKTDVVDNIHSLISNEISDFLLDYTLLGLAFDTESNVTVWNENPGSAERVRQTIKMLTHSGWSDHLHQLIFTVNDHQLGVKDLYVTEENVDRDIRHVYALLSFYYVEKLRDLLLYIIKISECYDSLSRAVDKLDLIETFVRTIEKIVPIVMRMKGSLQYLQRLSPQTWLDKDIIKVLEFYKNSIGAISFPRERLSIDLSMTAVEKNWDMLLNEKQRYLNILEEFDRGLIKYSQTLGVVSRKNRNTGTFEMLPADMEKKVVEEIASFENTVFPSFGFEYNLNSNPTVTLRSENKD